ncbi:lysylphosphatidylglycerol synthase transmembrane domain-containing protein [Candidatus Chloroploca sp. Khr17]|uniref:lysylphosphatidylglycerol synthase transmembrane domain-containing protein n=1 Tax=Candidatus Chloroploca sp. Khr17 TaxID=2496869 RepID=UPI00101D4557|nr:lysylphosphatidylglycerol synthase transmembrane domain-containing protein [Candidatus Chloroploca sp. Khr17]
MIDKSNTNEEESDFTSDALPDEAEVEQKGFVLWDRLRSPRTLISFGLAIAIVVFVFSGLNIDVRQTWQYIQQVNPWMLVLGFLIFYLTFPMRALRWRLLLGNAGVPVHEGRHDWASLPALMEYIYLSWFANCIVPAKLGDAYRGYLLKHNGRVSFSSAFGTIFAERLLDMLGLFLLLLISAWFTFGVHMPEGTQLIFGFGAILVVAILAGLAGMRWLGPVVRKIIPQRMHQFYDRFEHAALSSFKPTVLPRLILFTGMIWMLEGFRLFFVIEAFGPAVSGLSLSAIIFVALASSLLTALPITPAGLGVVEGAITVVLLFFGIEQSLGIAITLLDRLINFWSIVVGGFFVYLFSKRR